MARVAPPGEDCLRASVDGRTASGTPDDGVGGLVPRLPRGATLGRYVVLDCLGSGGMGVVYLAHDFALDRRVSLKLLRSVGKDPEARRERLVSEAQALARVSHPNVLAVHDVGTWEDEVYLALEHVEGETLRSWLDRAPRSPTEIRAMFLQAARGLQAIHGAGLIHRDVKPENLLLGRDGRVRVADLGLAITAGSQGSVPARETLRPGTPGYMPLEQHRGEPLDARADQYSLAVAIYEALLGQRPYGSRGASRETLQERLARGPAVEVPRHPAVPPRLRRALTASLRPDRAARPTTLAPLIEALASPGLPATGTLGGSLAVAASIGVLFFAIAQGGTTPVGSAEAAVWLPPAYEFQFEAVDPPVPLSVAGTGTAVPTTTAAVVREASGPLRIAAVSSAPGQAVTQAGPSVRPEALVIGQRPAALDGSAPGRAPGVDLGRLAELQKLVEALYRALSEPREGSSAPLLALPGATPATAGPVASAGAGTSGSSGPALVASAESNSGSGADWVDPSAANIAAIERRLDQLIRQDGSPREIAQTQFVLAQAIWNSSGDSADAQSRALDFARQSKAALDICYQQGCRDVSAGNLDSSVVELRQAVNDWISSREGPITKPHGGGLQYGHAQQNLESIGFGR